MCKYLLILFFNLFLGKQVVHASDLFMETIELLKINSDYIIENPEASEQISRKVTIVINSDENINNRLDLFFLVFLHHYHGFNKTKRNVITQFNNREDELTKKSLLLFVGPCLITEKKYNDLRLELKHLVTKDVITTYKNELTPFYKKLFYQIILHLNTNNQDSNSRKQLKIYIDITYFNNKYPQLPRVR